MSEEYQEYPKVLTHPTMRQPDGIKSGGKEMVNGVLVDMPSKIIPGGALNVTVNDADEEEYYRAKGYMPNGTSDPTAYHNTVSGNSTPESYEFQEYPKWVGNVLVQNREQEESVRGTLPVIGAQPKKEVFPEPIANVSQSPIIDPIQVEVMMKRLAELEAAEAARQKAAKSSEDRKEKEAERKRKISEKARQRWAEKKAAKSA